MACACTQRKKAKYLWYDPVNSEGVEPIIYNSEIEAKAKVIRGVRKFGPGMGGRYIPYDANMSIGTQIAAAEALRAQVAG